MNAGTLMKSALVAVVLLALIGSGSAVNKLSSCCKTVSSQPISGPITGYMVQKASPPCVRAIIFQTEQGLFCSQVNAPWVRRKIIAFEKAKALATPSSTASLLSIITSTASPPSASSVPLLLLRPQVRILKPAVCTPRSLKRKRQEAPAAIPSFIHPFSSKMERGTLMKSALVAVVLLALVRSGSAVDKLTSYCSVTSRQEITDAILGYRVQRVHPPAVIFQTAKGFFCSYPGARWVRRKIEAFRNAKAVTATASAPPSSTVSLLAIITSAASPSPSSLPPSSSSIPPSSSSSSAPFYPSSSEATTHETPSSSSQ
ncbi:uncharacterized protein [Antennarius striatus]|uniref:uncharacterized protein n=1 Tax=Antennarius striatus TaxID=241820 RepID=UPI0035AFB20B